MHDHRRLKDTPLEPDVRQPALLLWPGLDPVQLSRTRGRVVRLVARRTPLDSGTILGMLLRDDMTPLATAVPPGGG